MIYLTIYLYLMAGLGFGFAGHMILKEIKGKAYSEDLFIILFCWIAFTLVWLPMLIALLVLYIYRQENFRNMFQVREQNSDQGGPL